MNAQQALAILQKNTHRYDATRHAAAQFLSNHLGLLVETRYQRKGYEFLGLDAYTCSSKCYDDCLSFDEFVKDWLNGMFGVILWHEHNPEKDRLDAELAYWEQFHP